ncbi:MAG: response regulator transcription factor [Saprospiraceae bacterium]|nr:response regulator transcription factor [Saprospiraceae bacterium]
MINLVIVEDDTFLLNTLSLILQSEKDIEIIGLFCNTEAALKEIPILNPDIVLMDLDFGTHYMTGIECIARLKSIVPDINFLILTIYGDHEKVFEALAVGALGYILKSSTKEKIIESIHELMEGGSPMTPSIARKIAMSFSNNKQDTHHYDEVLTAREIEVINLISKGKLEKEVADELRISYKTVKSHITNIYSKLQVHTRVDALNKYFGR